MRLDPRTHPYRPDLAAAHLRGRVDASRFVEGKIYQIVEPIVDLRRGPSHAEVLETQALYGERLIVYEMTDEGWAWGQLESDGYVGWLAANALGAPGRASSHRVIAPRTLAFPTANIKTPPLAGLPMGAALALVREDERFAVAENGWYLPRSHLAPFNVAQSDFVAVAEMFLGAPYLWGGKSTLGIDCSGLVQIALRAAGVECPRDSDMQEAALGDAVTLSDLQRGDLIFWRGHVAIACDPDTLIHANAQHMMVMREPVSEAIARIARSGSEVRAVKRVRPYGAAEPDGPYELSL